MYYNYGWATLTLISKYGVKSTKMQKRIEENMHELNHARHPNQVLGFKVSV